VEDRYQEQGDDVRLDAPTPVVRVVLAEPDAPGPLQYLLEAEGFRVVGCASDEVELDRILQQDVDPDVVVLDTEFSIASVAVARERAPAAHVISEPMVIIRRARIPAPKRKAPPGSGRRLWRLRNRPRAHSTRPTTRVASPMQSPTDTPRR
jgi:hypothetical protein